ncbi:glycosyl transferase [Aureococcus anophagefferens]|nr:glycosyl transferase [Aureococcus anophagefferens]
MRPLWLLLASLAAAYEFLADCGAGGDCGDAACFLDLTAVQLTTRYLEVSLEFVRVADGAREPFRGSGSLGLWAVAADDGSEWQPPYRQDEVRRAGTLRLWVDGLPDLGGTLHANFGGLSERFCNGSWFYAHAAVDVTKATFADDVAVAEDATPVGTRVGRQRGGLVLVDGVGEEPNGLPIRLSLPATRSALVREALAAVERHRLWARPLGDCGAGDRLCVAERLADEVVRPVPEPRCRLRFDRPRDGEVESLSQLDAELSVERYDDDAAGWVRLGRFAGELFVDAWASDAGTALGTWAPMSAWIDVPPEDEGNFFFHLVPPARRPGGGGSSRRGARGEVTVNAALRGRIEGCGEPGWLHATTRSVYRPFHEPDPPAPVLDRAALAARPDARAALGLTCAYASILYDTSEDTGYAHGLLALRRSLVEAGAADPLYALLGDGVDARTRGALSAAGLLLVDAGGAAAPGEPAAALPMLGVGQWAKLQLWKLPADRVLYLDADVVVLRNVDELFAALERRGGPPAPLAAVDDYFSGGVLFLAPNAAEERAFAATLAQDSGRYVYGEQDFLNVHFGGAHARLDAQYKCLTESVLKGERDAATCAVLEFSSCPGMDGMMAWKPWHGTAMFDAAFEVCGRRINGDLAALAARWRGFHRRALADLAARGASLAPAPAYGRYPSHRVAKYRDEWYGRANSTFPYEDLLTSR